RRAIYVSLLTIPWIGGVLLVIFWIDNFLRGDSRCAAAVYYRRHPRACEAIYLSWAIILPARRVSLIAPAPVRAPGGGPALPYRPPRNSWAARRAGRGRPPCPQRHLLGPAIRSTMARSAWELWLLHDLLQPFRSLAAGWYLGPAYGRVNHRS